jgi:hypothetical protein
MRVGGDACDPDPSATQLDEEEHVEPFEHERVDGEKSVATI